MKDLSLDLTKAFLAEHFKKLLMVEFSSHWTKFTDFIYNLNKLFNVRIVDSALQLFKDHIFTLDYQDRLFKKLVMMVNCNILHEDVSLVF
jgi:hypothetical protein